MEFYYTKDGRYSALRDWAEIIGTMLMYLGGFYLGLQIIGFIVRRTI